MTLRSPITPTAAVAVAVILVTEAVFVGRTEPLTGLPIFQPTVDDATLVAKRTLLPAAAGRPLFAGDSSCTMGLEPTAFESGGLGRPVNLGTLASFTLPGFADLAEEALGADPPPRVLVVAVLPRSFEMSEAQARDFSLLGRYLTAYGRRSPEYELGAADRVSWFVRKHRYNIFPQAFGGSYQVYADRLREGDGAYKEHGTYTGAAPGEFKAEFQPTTYCRQALRHLAAAAASRGVSFVFWWSPSPADAVSPEYLLGASRLVSELAAECPGMALGRPTAPAWEPRWFGSVTHLNQLGARKNSAELAEYIRGRGFAAR